MDTDRDIFDTYNGYCMNRRCNHRGTFMLPGPGHQNFHDDNCSTAPYGNAHCPKCGAGKLVAEHIISDQLIVWASEVLAHD